MARLFITEREIDLINHWTAEVIRDVNGQKVHYFSISRELTRVHDVYRESPDKVFENPIVLDAFVEWKESEVKANQFGIEQVRTIEVFVQARDLIKRGIEVAEGDFLSYGPQFFEVIQATSMRPIYGQVEHIDGIKIVCREARQSQFLTKLFGPTGEEFSDADAVQKTFVQQRGLAKNSEGETGDKRDVYERGLLDKPDSAREVSSRGGDRDSSSFYDE